MSKLSTNEIRIGAKLLIDGEPCVVVANEGVKPGKGQAFNRIRLKHFATGRVVERTYKSGDMIDVADLHEAEMTFLYAEGEEWVFMDAESFEQISVSKEAMQGAYLWIKEGDVCVVTIWNDRPMHVAPPMFIHRRISECEPAVRGDTVSGVMKQAVIETGAQIKVPLFVQLDDIVRIDTRTGEYVSRVKDEG